MNLVRSVWGWLRRQVVEDVPAEIALCEFDCPKSQCNDGEWQTCERRLRSAVGELLPPPDPVSDQTPERNTGTDRGRV